MADTLGAGQLALTGSVQALSTGSPAPDKNVNGVIIKAHAANAGKMYVGGVSTVSSTTGYELSPGETLAIEVINPGRIYVIGTNTDRVCYATVKA